MLAKAKRKLQAGLVLIELLITVLILIVALGGLLQLFIYCQKLAVMAGGITLATSEAEAKIEEMRNHNFDDIVADYDGMPFDLTQLTGKGIIYIDDSNPELLEIEVVASWQTMDNRIIGEDKNLDGILDPGEDASDPANNKLDSPTALASIIAKR